MLRGKSTMGFRSVKRVEVKAETTTPGELRTTTDANGARVSTSRGRRTLPKLEFTIEEDGAVLHGPQRGLYPYHLNLLHQQQQEQEQAAAQALDEMHHEDTLWNEQDTSVHGFEDRNGSESMLGYMEDESHEMEDNQVSESLHSETNRQSDTSSSQAFHAQHMAPASTMKECILNDTRATTLAIKYDESIGRFVCGSSIERFSGHTGVCRVLGSKKYPVIPHNLQVGDLLRIGSVGLVVCEINRTDREETLEALTDEEYQFLKEHYLSLPLQQTFHPPEAGNNQDGNDDCKKARSGETSDEADSEEDHRGGDNANDQDDDYLPEDEECASPRASGATGLRGKRFCYICYDGDEEPDVNPLVAPCHCKGDTKYVHLECLQRWNNNLDADGSNPNHKVCAVTNTDGLDVCSICKATYLTSVKLEDGRLISLLAKKLPPPYVTFAVVTQHETRNRSTALTNTRFQLSFANLPKNQQFLTIGRSTSNNMTLRYRTVSQLHAKIKFQENQFFLMDAGSSNGTMLFLSRPLELDWGKMVHVKIGRTILTLRAKKRWKWAGGEADHEEMKELIQDLSSPPYAATTPRYPMPMVSNNNASINRFLAPGVDSEGRPHVVSDPSIEWLSQPPPMFPSHRHSRPFESPCFSTRLSDSDTSPTEAVPDARTDRVASTGTVHTSLGAALQELMAQRSARSSRSENRTAALQNLLAQRSGRSSRSGQESDSMHTLIDRLTRSNLNSTRLDLAARSSERESTVRE